MKKNLLFCTLLMVGITMMGAVKKTKLRVLYVGGHSNIETFAADYDKAENERSNIKRRQREGIDAAMQKGVKFGRPAIPLPDNFYVIYEKWQKKEIPVEKAAAMCGFSRTTFYNKANEFGQKKYTFLVNNIVIVLI